jgi:phage protein U
MSNFNRATTKIEIGSVDRPTPEYTVKAQFNPKELQVDKSVPWQKVNQANQSNKQGIHLEFTGAEGRSMTVELLFDAYEDKNGSVLGQVQTLEKLASVIDPTSTKENDRRPHRCVAKWGSTLTAFRCVIESLSTKYTMFTDDGTPVRATCTVKLKEADIVSAKGAGQHGGGQHGGTQGAPPAGGTPPTGGTPGGT